MKFNHLHGHCVSLFRNLVTILYFAHRFVSEHLMMKSYALRKRMDSFEVYLFIHTMQLLIKMFFISWFREKKQKEEEAILPKLREQVNERMHNTKRMSSSVQNRQ